MFSIQVPTAYLVLPQWNEPLICILTLCEVHWCHIVLAALTLFFELPQKEGHYVFTSFNYFYSLEH